MAKEVKVCASCGDIVVRDDDHYLCVGCEQEIEETFAEITRRETPQGKETISGEY